MLAPRMNAAYRAIVRAPWLVVAAIGAVTVVLGLRALRLRVDSSVTTLLPPGRPPKPPHDQVRGRLRRHAGDIAPASGGAAVTVFLAADAANDEASVRRIDAALESLIAEVGAHGPEQLVLTGISHIKVNALALMRRDLAALTPASLAFVVLVLF